MNRSTFFKSAIAATAVFFGFKSANKPYKTGIDTFNLPFTGNGIRDVKFSNSRGTTWAPEGTGKELYFDGGMYFQWRDDKITVKEYTYDFRGTLIRVRDLG